MGQPTLAPEHAAGIRKAVDTLHRPLVSYARSLLGDLHLAQDTAQDALLALCRQPPELLERLLPPNGSPGGGQSGGGQLKAWLLTTTRNRALDHRRRPTPVPLTTPAATAQPSPTPPPGERIDRAERHAALLAAVDRLPEAQREAVRLRFEHGLKYRQIAEVTGTSTGQVGYLLHEAMTTLRHDLSRAVD